MNSTRKFKSVALAIAGVILIPSCATTGNANTRKVSTATTSEYPVKAVELGKASWYSIRTNYGTKTASGERLCNDAATAALAHQGNGVLGTKSVSSAVGVGASRTASQCRSFSAQLVRTTRAAAAAAAAGVLT